MTDLMIPDSAEALAARQAEGRRRAVERAQAAPLLRDRLAGVDLAHVTEPEEWAKLPILDKDMLRALSPEAFYADFCIAPRRAVAEYWRSGGSTGRPLFYPRTREDLRYGLIGFRRVLDCAGLTAEDVTHMSLPLGVHPAGHLMGRAAADMEMGVVWAGGGNTLPSAAQLDMMRLFRPTAWIGMASYGLQLANLARADGFDIAGSGVSRVLCTAEPLSASKRAKLASLFGAEVRDSFGMTEMMMLGAEDGAADGFRFWSDFCYPEVLRPDSMEPVAEGEPGLLVVTALATNNATPFLRWNTGDIVTMRSPAPDGSRYGVFPLIRHTRRTAGFVKVRGVNIGFTEFEDFMFAAPEVADFRADVTTTGARDELELHLEFAAGCGPDAAARIAAAVRRAFELEPKVIAAEAGAIARGFEGDFKPQRFRDLRG